MKVMENWKATSGGNDGGDEDGDEDTAFGSVVRWPAAIDVTQLAGFFFTLS